MGLKRWVILLGLAVPSGSAIGVDLDDAPKVYSVGGIKISDPWAKSSGSGVHAAKLFFEFQNEADQSDELIDVQSIVASGPISFMLAQGSGASRSLATIEGIEIPVSEKSFELSEVGYYIELTGFELPVLMGTRFPVKLTFARAGSISIEFVTRFHSPKFLRRIREAATRGDIEMLKALRPVR